LTDIDVYQPAAPAQYGAATVMTPDDARALDEQVRRCTEAVLREGTDYGVIPGTNGEKTLWRPGAQKLLQWFGLGYSCDRIEVERDDDGRKHGITYKCTVARRLPDGTLDIKATCEGTADYDETKFYKSAEQVQREAETRERAWAEQYKRPPRPTYWQGLPEYRAPWNTLMKRAQKRAIVGAVNDATAAGGIFADREEDDSPAPQDDGPTWYQQALTWAATLTDEEEGRKLFVEAAQAARDGLCTPGQANHVQNRITQRVQLLKKATPVDAEDLGRQAGGQVEPDPTPPAAPAATSTGTASSTAPAADGPSDTPADDKHRRLIGAVQDQFKRFGFTVDDTDREHRMTVLAQLAAVRRDGTDWYQSTSDFDEDELKTALRKLTRCKDIDALKARLDAAGQAGDGDA
jgi:hypothetical protein